MNNYASEIDNADAFLAVVDRKTLHAHPSGALMRTLVHECQKNYFDVWASGVIALPIIVFGRIWRRNCAGEKTQTELPITCCGDAAAATMTLLAHSKEAKLATPNVVRSTIYLVRLSNPQQQREILSTLMSLPSVSLVSNFDGEAAK